MTIQEVLKEVAEGRDLSYDVMRAIMMQMMSGDLTDAQIGALLMGLRMKGETVTEVTAAAQVMRDLVSPVETHSQPLVDLAGTGGDSAHLFNVSTEASIVAAAGGASVAKHGNRSVSSSSGSSDVLSELGMPLDLDSSQVARAIDSVGIGFLFAPAHHSAMRYAIGPRRDLGMRTLFNILGPLTNPAFAKRQVVGVFEPSLCDFMAQVLAALGTEHALVVHGHGGLDELSLSGPSDVTELRDGQITHYQVTPEQLGYASTSLASLVVTSATESALLISNALANKAGDQFDAARAMIALNAGAALYVSGCAQTLTAGVELAADVIATGQAKEKLSSFIQFTQIMAAAAIEL